MITVELKWWHIALALVVVAGLICMVLGKWYGLASLVSGLGVMETKRRREGADPTDALPERPDAEQTDIHTDAAKQEDDAEEAVADDYVDSMSDDEVWDELESRDLSDDSPSGGGPSRAGPGDMRPQ